MTQNVSSQYMEAAAKMAKLLAKNANAKASQNSAFKNYMQETSKAKQDAPKMDNSKKDVQKPEVDKPTQPSTDAKDTVKDEPVSKPNNSQTNEEETESTQGKSEKDVLMDLALMAQMLNQNVTVEATAEETQGMQTQGETNVAATALQETLSVQSDTNAVSVAAEQNAAQPQVAAAQTNAQTANIAADAAAKQAESKIGEGKVQTQSNDANVAQTLNQTQNAKGTKQDVQTNVQRGAEDAAKLQSKTPEIKVQVETNQQQGNNAEETKTEDTNEAALLAAAKNEKQEMPVVTVKVGDGGQLDAKAMAEDVADAIIKKMPTGKNEFEIQLNPRDLGKITIKLLFENGQTLVSLSANNAKATAMLSECAKSIGALIQQHTGNETVVTVQDDKGFAEQQQKQEGNRQNAESKQQENAQKQKNQQATNQNFMQQMRLGLFETDFAESRTRFY